MFLRAWIAFVITVVMMLLVVLQMQAADKVKFLTVEQVAAQGIKGMSFDRHYAMPIDFCILAPFVGLVILLCASQWTFVDGVWSAAVAVPLTVGLVVFWLSLPGKEAHNQSLEAAILHGVFFATCVWASLMVACFTPKPEPVLLLSMCIIIPAFLFIGNHMYLGLINWTGAASTYTDKPLSNFMGWAIIVGVSAALWVRTYFLIPQSFWDGLQ